MVFEDQMGNWGREEIWRGTAKTKGHFWGCMTTQDDRFFKFVHI